MIEVDEGVRRPELVPQFVSGDNFSRVFQQRSENLQWLLLQLHPQSTTSQFTCLEINFKDPKPDDPS
jgi:hypothetical protein